jgi:3'(2'), 5'-bisphosphate nucleotidase
MPAFQKELSTAIAAVVRASRLTQNVFKSLQAGQKGSAGIVTKIDKSPVTIADYGSQAIVNAVLQSVFPADPIVGEEDSNELRVNTELRHKVWDLVSSTLQATPAKEMEQTGGQIRIDEEMLDLIDKGNYAGGQKGRIIPPCPHCVLMIQDFGHLIQLTGLRDF